jgi:hypothetical protein
MMIWNCEATVCLHCTDSLRSDAKTLPVSACAYAMMKSNQFLHRSGGAALHSSMQVVRVVSDSFLQRSHCNVNTNRSNLGINSRLANKKFYSNLTYGLQYFCFW